MNASVKLIIKSTLENVQLIGLAAKSISSLQFSTVKECNYIETAIIEALTNIVKHAYKNNSDRTIETTIELCDNGICFTLTDKGHCFNPANAPPFNFDPNDLDNLPENGMGIHIYNIIMDEVHYLTTNGKNELKLVKYIPQEM